MKKGSKVKVSNWKIVSDLDLVQVVFTFGTPSSNDKGYNAFLNRIIQFNM